MNEETIIDDKQFAGKKPQTGKKMTDNEHANAPKNVCNAASSKEGKKRAAGVAGLAGAAGLAAGVLTPKQMFPNNIPGTDDIELDSEEPTDEVVPSAGDHVTGHDMDVASGVDDTMSFNEAFAAARHEVGTGGLFVWHGNTYGTYYANEWNAMSPDDKEQYWADVHHTTSNINHNAEHHSDDGEPEPPLAEVPSDPPGGWDGEGDPNDDNPDPTDPEPVDPEPPLAEIPDDPLGGWDGTEHEPFEPEPPLTELPPDPSEEPEPLEPLDPSDELADLGINPDDGKLYLSEDQINGTIDEDLDGVIDGLEVDVNGNEIPDLVLDADGDGTFDTLQVDADIDGSVAEIHGIADVEIVDGDTGMDSEIEDPMLASFSDIDFNADDTLDVNIPIDNNMDMSDFA